MKRQKRVVDGLEITIYDLGGQTSYQDGFTGGQAEWVFSGVRAFVWVIGARDPQTIPRSLYYFNRSIKHLADFSPKASVFVLQHKIDIPTQYDSVLGDFQEELDKFYLQGTNLAFEYYETSIFSPSFMDFLARIIDVTVSSNIMLMRYLEAERRTTKLRITEEQRKDD